MTPSGAHGETIRSLAELQHGVVARWQLLERGVPGHLITTLQMCFDHRLARPQVNWWDGERELDFRWPEHRLVVETDGWGVHRTRRAFETPSGAHGGQHPARLR